MRFGSIKNFTVKGCYHAMNYLDTVKGCYHAMRGICMEYA
jgi:hypothetical protein